MEERELALSLREGLAPLSGVDFGSGEACGALEQEDAVEEGALFVAQASDELLRAEQGERGVVAVLQRWDRDGRGRKRASRAGEDSGEEGKITESAFQSLSHPTQQLLSSREPATSSSPRPRR